MARSAARTWLPRFSRQKPSPSSSQRIKLALLSISCSLREATWEKLIAGAREMDLSGQRVLVPRPEYLVALKLHAAASPTRSKPEVDWEDIRQIVRICALDPERDESFRELILRYGGEDALAKIQSFGRRR